MQIHNEWCNHEGHYSDNCVCTCCTGVIKLMEQDRKQKEREFNFFKRKNLMQTHLSYSTYEKLREKFGEERIDQIIDKIGIDLTHNNFRFIDMNVILSKEFIDLLTNTHSIFLDDVSRKYYLAGMPAVEEYILLLI